MQHHHSIVLISLTHFLTSIVSGSSCVRWTPRYIEADGPSMVYSEAVSSEDGIGTQ